LVVIDKRSNDFGIGPFRFSKVLLGKLVPSTLICGIDFCYIVIEDGLVEMENKLLGMPFVLLEPQRRKLYALVLLH
jgi:hypothetical protein